MTTKTKVNLTAGFLALTFVVGLVFKFMPASVESPHATDGTGVVSPHADEAQGVSNAQASGLPSDRGVNTQKTEAMGSGSAGNSAAGAPQEEEELSEEEKLAKVDPVWRKTWEHYKKMFLLAQQMRQQPPAKPVMPHVRQQEPEPPPHRDDASDDDDPNPFRFPEE